MKTRITSLLLLLSMFMVAKASPVSEEQAREVGAMFLNGTMKTTTINADALRLVKTYYCEAGEAGFYVFSADTGFVIVSADDCATPILGYSCESSFDPDDIPIQMQDYLGGFLEQIEYGVANHLVADDITTAEWERVQATGKVKAVRSTHVVLPLLSEKWSQDCGYNRYCPEDTSGVCGHTYTGCVATAMAQIMHYWRYPTTGQESHSYTPASHPEYGVQSVDFSTVNYRWDDMPNQLYNGSSEAEIDAVATLMYHCGVSVDMNYGPSGSGAFSADVVMSLVKYFNYSNELEGRNKLNNDYWIADLKACLDLGRPLYYSGQSDGVGHAFVCDGYDEEDMMHFNWGWGGSSNGYFAIGALNVANYSFNTSNYAIFNIHAPSDPNHLCQVNVSVDPMDGGTVDGGGSFQYGDFCTLYAHATDNSSFIAWVENGMFLSNDTAYTFLVREDRDIKARFYTEGMSQVEVTCTEDTTLSAHSAVISWSNNLQGGGIGNGEWPLLGSMECSFWSMSGFATDGKYFYVSPWGSSDSLSFFKYDLAGKLIESFSISGCAQIYDFAYDGQYFYGTCDGANLCCLDLADKTLVDVIHTSCRNIRGCTYDPDQDAFWVNNYFELKLIDRNGQWLKSCSVPQSCSGIAYYKNDQGEPHLLLFCRDGNMYSGSKVYDYDINADVLGQEVLCDFNVSCGYVGAAAGAFVGEYLGKAAFLGYLHNANIASQSFGAFYEFPLDVSQVRYHRVYRVEGTVDEKGPMSEPVLIADRHCGSSFTDQSWDTLPSGTYTYGISVLRAGEECGINWSNSMEHVRRYTIGVSADIEEGGTVSGQGVYEDGSECTLTATANADYAFVAWLKNDTVVSTEPVFSFVVMEDAEYVAHFEYTVVEVYAYPRPATAGVVTGAGTYHKGDTVTLTVTPNPDYRFSKWVEDDVTVSDEPTISFVVTTERTLYADLLYNYAIDEQGEKTLVISPNPAGHRLTVECSQPIRRCEVFSITGALVYCRDDVNGEQMEIEVEDFSSGLYLIRLVLDEASLTGRFVKR